MNRQNTTNRVKVRMRGFSKAFDSLPKNRIKSVREELMGRLKWSLSVFYYKKRGDTPLWEREALVIEEIFKRFGLGEWSDKQI